MKVVDMEHKFGVKDDAAIQHGIGEKISLDKKTESGLKSVTQKLETGAAVAIKSAPTVKRAVGKIVGNPVVKAGGKVVSMTASAVDKAVGSIDNEVVQLGVKSFRIASSAVRLGGKTVKVAAKTSGQVIKNTFKLSRAVAQKVRLAKKNVKKLKVRTSKLYKAMAAANAAKKYVVKPAVKTVKIGANAAGTVIDKGMGALGNIENDAVQFAKKTYDVVNAAGALTLKTGKASAKAVKVTGKTARTLLTKKGRRGLVNSVKRSVQRVKRTVRNIRNAVRLTVKAAKFIAKMVAKAAKLVAQLAVKLVNLIASTAPWSLIIMGVIALLIIAVNIITALIADEEQDKTAGLVDPESDITEISENMTEFEELFAEVCKENITDPLKSTVSSFCVDPFNNNQPPQRIIVYNGTLYYPARGKASTINPAIENYVSSSLSTDRFVAMLAALKVFVRRETDENPEEAFTKDDFKAFIGTVNGNTCGYGDTFFIKTTSTVSGQTCPGSNCRVRYCKEGCCTRINSDGETEQYCPGHRYCDHDHVKMTITLKTVEEYTGKSVPEIYGFDEEEEYLYDAYVEFIDALIEDMKDPDSPTYHPPITGGTSEDYNTSYEPADFSISSSNVALLILLVLGLIALGIRKRGG